MNKHKKNIYFLIFFITFVAFILFRSAIIRIHYIPYTHKELIQINTIDANSITIIKQYYSELTIIFNHIKSIFLIFLIIILLNFFNIISDKIYFLFGILMNLLVVLFLGYGFLCLLKIKAFTMLEQFPKVILEYTLVWLVYAIIFYWLEKNRKEKHVPCSGSS